MKRFYAWLASLMLDMESYWQERNNGKWQRWHTWVALGYSAIYRWAQPRSGRTFGTHDAPMVQDDTWVFFE